MSEENKTVELKDEDLEKVAGGGSGTFNGITYKDGDVYASKTEDLSTMYIDVYVLKNCGQKTCDADSYMYNKNTKEFIYLCPYFTSQDYFVLANDYVKLDISFNK